MPGITYASIMATTPTRLVRMRFLGVLLIFAGFLVSEEVFKNIRIGATLWSRSPSDRTLVTEASSSGD